MVCQGVLLGVDPRLKTLQDLRKIRKEDSNLEANISLIIGGDYPKKG